MKTICNTGQSGFEMTELLLRVLPGCVAEHRQPLPCSFLLFTYPLYPQAILILLSLHSSPSVVGTRTQKMSCLEDKTRLHSAQLTTEAGSQHQPALLGICFCLIFTIKATNLNS